jgi:hypothetical protein
MRDQAAGLEIIADRDVSARLRATARRIQITALASALLLTVVVLWMAARLS